MNDLLQRLAAITGPGKKWVARWSASGRGFRLHQCAKHLASCWTDHFEELSACTGDTPEEALTAFMEREKARLTRLLVEARDAYYFGAEPTMSDSEYAAMEKDLQALGGKLPTQLPAVNTRGEGDRDEPNQGRATSSPTGGPSEGPVQ